MRLRALSIATLLLAAACRSTGSRPGTFASIDESVPQLLASASVPGAAVAIIEGGSVRTRAYGVADVESGSKVDDSTVFEAASIGKVVFAYAALQLVDRGALDLDRPLQSYLATPYIDDPRASKITARMVLSHRSGLPNWRKNGEALQLTADPGSRFSYSGEGFLFLQKVVESITREPIDGYMKRAVFDPIGMPHSSYLWQPFYDEHKAWGHTTEGKRWRRRQPQGAIVAATLHTTAADLGAFTATLMAGTGLSPQMSAEMFRIQSSVSESCAVCSDRPAVEQPARDIHWGLGVGLLNQPAGSFFWHWGDDGDFKAYLFGSRETRRAVVILTNGANGLRIAGEIARVALGEPDTGAPAKRPLEWLHD